MEEDDPDDTYIRGQPDEFDPDRLAGAMAWRHPIQRPGVTVERFPPRSAVNSAASSPEPLPQRSKE